jgi:dTDP-L-rhamnose 4-epimerase
MTEVGHQAILVTGGAGFIGCAVSQVLAPISDCYVVIDNLHPQVHPKPTRPAALHQDADLIVADVTDPSAWDHVLHQVKPDVILHLAAETGTGQSLVQSTRHGTVNVVGTTQMLDAFTRHGIRPSHIVLSSSRAVYGEGQWIREDGSTFYPGQRTHAQLEAGQWDFPGASALPSAAVNTKPDPTSIYGATKLAQEHILAAWCRSTAVPLTILRFQNVYGPGQSLTNPYTGIVTLFSQLAADGRPIPLFEDGYITRDFVFIDDTISAIYAAIYAPTQPLLTLDIGSGTGCTIQTLAEELAALHNAPPPEVTGRFRDGDVRHASCRISHTSDAIGWIPRRNLPEGLRALQQWIAGSRG